MDRFLLSTVRQQGAAPVVVVMVHDQNTWQLAKRMLEQHGLHAMYGAKAISADLRDMRSDGDATTCLQVVRAMDFLLSDEGSDTLH